MSGRVRLELDELTVREAPEGPLSGPGLRLEHRRHGRLDADEVEQLRDELTVWLQERGR